MYSNGRAAWYLLLDFSNYAKALEEYGINLIKEGTDPLQCAGVMMAQALQHYKSLLNAEEYNKMVKLMADSKDSVKAFIKPTVN